MKKFGYRFALIAGVTSLLVSASIAPVSLAKLSGKNVPSSTQTKQTKPSQKIAFLPVVVGGVVLGADTVIKITAIYIGLCGLKTPSDCGKNATKAINEINAYLKQTDSKVTMTLKQAHDTALKYKNAIVAPPKSPGIKPKTPRQNNIVPFNRKDRIPPKPSNRGTDNDDDLSSCEKNIMNDILNTHESLSTSEIFQRTATFPDKFIVCVSKKISNKQQLTEKIRSFIETAKKDTINFQGFTSLRALLPLKKPATIFVSSSTESENRFVPENPRRGENHWFFQKENLFSDNIILLLSDFKYFDVAYAVYQVALLQEWRRPSW